MLLDGQNLFDLDEEGIRRVRGRRIGFVFQEPMVALDPVYTIGAQIAETLAVHDLARGAAARARAVELLAAVARARSGATRARISAPTQRRPAPARDDCARALRRAGAASSRTSRPPRSTSPCRPRSSTCCAICGGSSTCRCCSSRTTSGSWPKWPTASPSCTRDASSSRRRWRGCSTRPAHPYTRALLASVPGGRHGERLMSIAGNVPALGHLPDGCAFGPRCPDRFARCAARLRHRHHRLRPRRPVLPS